MHNCFVFLWVWLLNTNTERLPAVSHCWHVSGQMLLLLFCLFVSFCFCLFSPLFREGGDKAPCPGSTHGRQHVQAERHLQYRRGPQRAAVSHLRVEHLKITETLRMTDRQEGALDWSKTVNLQPCCHCMCVDDTPTIYCQSCNCDTKIALKVNNIGGVGRGGIEGLNQK